MISQKFFKLFPPPKFLDIPYAGLDISDDAIRAVEYSSSARGLSIRRFGTRSLAPGVIVAGEIKDDKALSEAISALANELKISVVKASLPEEKMYLFKTEIPTKNKREIYQNIEFKLEENVPLSPAESVFFFDVMRNNLGDIGQENIKSKPTQASVSVAPRALVETYLNIIKGAGLGVLSFEIQPKAIARALIDKDSRETQMIVYFMDNKTGIYIIYGRVVCFTSTVPWTSKAGERDEKENGDSSSIGALRKHLEQVNEYWTKHDGTKISRIILAGRPALTEGLLAECSFDPEVPVEIGDVWKNAFSPDKYIPPISYEDSLDYVVAAGLALPLQTT